MTTDIKELVKRLAAGRTLLLRADGDRDLGFQSNITTDTSMALADELKSAIDALEAMAGEVERLKEKNEALAKVASQTDRAARDFFAKADAITKEADQEIEDLHDALKVVLARAEAAESERDRLKAAVTMVLEEFGYSLPPDTVLELRKALGGDA